LPQFRTIVDQFCNGKEGSSIRQKRTSRRKERSVRKEKE